ncbi:MAG: hypothetical protein DMG72_20255 [Acidobacteria bacterium]|nr:MAG: hypothetical protein DMG72_20255 [Acidobacteriota bacterium]
MRTNVYWTSTNGLAVIFTRSRGDWLDDPTESLRLLYSRNLLFRDIAMNSLAGYLISARNLLELLSSRLR